MTYNNRTVQRVFSVPGFVGMNQFYFFPCTQPPTFNTPSLYTFNLNVLLSLCSSFTIRFQQFCCESYRLSLLLIHKILFLFLISYILVFRFRSSFLIHGKYIVVKIATLVLLISLLWERNFFFNAKYMLFAVCSLLFLLFSSSS